MKKALLILFILTGIIFSQKLTTLKSTDKFVEVEIDFRNSYFLGDTVINEIRYDYVRGEYPNLSEKGSPSLPVYSFRVGIPFDAKVSTKIISNEQHSFANKFILPQASMMLTEAGVDDELVFDKAVYASNKNFPENTVEDGGTFVFRNANVAVIAVNPYQFNPVTRTLTFNKKIKLRVNIIGNSVNTVSAGGVSDKMTSKYLESGVINSANAKKWTTHIKPDSPDFDENYWYKPSLSYVKIYVEENDIYRVTYRQLDSMGFKLSGVISSELRMYNDGKEVPIEVFDGDNKVFEDGDYIQFVGFPPKATNYAKQNIYNKYNIYWLTSEKDSVGLRYRNISGYPANTDSTFQRSEGEIHLEEDHMFERFGHAEDLQRDNWVWAAVKGRDGVSTEQFTASFEFPENRDQDANTVDITYSLHGMEKSAHQVILSLLSQPFGVINFTGQEEIEYTQQLDLNNFSLAPIINLQVNTYGGQPQAPSDEIRVNWINLKFPRYNRVFGEYFKLKSPLEAIGKKAKYELWYWQGDSMKVYIPSLNDALTKTKPLNNSVNTFQFMHKSFQETEYYCFSENYYREPDSFSVNVNSDLRNVSNGADYIIVTHPDFMEAANELAEFRRNNLEGYDNARVAVVNIMDVYNEFNYGLLAPEALRSFMVYAFFEWQTPQPAYLALLGDMSWDYRGKIPGSRKNYIPSMARHTYEHGYTVADNLFVNVSGADFVPDVAVGRISCETPEEAALLVDKIKTYPQDKSKFWLQNSLLIGAGQNDLDEYSKGFNDQSLYLDDNYISKVGFSSDKVFYFPNKPRHEPFRGATPEIREGFNSGAVTANFYGHGGGYQWDAVFISDDIELLENWGRMPFISSITCYTAHFDNQKVFGELFNLEPGKGSIGFWGHTGVTFWNYGVDMNKKLHNFMFLEGHEVMGDAILFAKSSFNGIPSKQTIDHISCLTLLGDPALRLAMPEHADFMVSNSSIFIEPEAPIVDEFTKVFVEIDNIGRYNAEDSVFVTLNVNGPDTTFQLMASKISSFTTKDTLEFSFTPVKDGLFTFDLVINGDNALNEGDLSDNSASASFPVFSIAEPSIVSPTDGAVLTIDQAHLILADVAEYVGRNLTYFVEVDTSFEFNQPIFVSDEIVPNYSGFIEIEPEGLAPGKYFWRSRIKEGDKYSYWSRTRTFTVVEQGQSKNGFFLDSEQLKTLDYTNMTYLPEKQALQMNREHLPPEPRSTRWLDDVTIDSLPVDVHSLTALATDGSYMYFGHMAYYGLVNDDYDEATPIYRIGTGFNGTTKGLVEGPISNNRVPVWKTMFVYNGELYFSQIDPYTIIKMNVTTGDTFHVNVPTGFLGERTGLVTNHASYITADEKYFYNLAFQDTTGEYKYTLRVLDPENNWALVHEDKEMSGESFEGFSSFFVADSHLYVFEKNINNISRKYSLESYIYLNEWRMYENRFHGYYAFCFDFQNDKVYSSVFYTGKDPKFSVFKGTYNRGVAELSTLEIGPAASWGDVSYVLETENSLGEYNVELEAHSIETNEWIMLQDTLQPLFATDDSLNGTFDYLRMNFTFLDTSAGDEEILRLKEIDVEYNSYPEVIISRSYISFSPDTLMQGFDTEVSLDVKNVGQEKADSVHVDFFLNDADTAFYSEYFDMESGTEKVVKTVINSSLLLFDNKISTTVKVKNQEMFEFNNAAASNFYVSRDSTLPVFDISFDEREIIDGDLVSSDPVVRISLEDNSPLELKPEHFFIYHNLKELKVSQADSMEYNYEPYPNSKAEITWNPEFDDGNHRLEVLAKDASNNFFDTTAYIINFRVDTENKIEDIYNYPNPFTDDTWFTFTLTGSETPDELEIRIYTVTGRLIKIIELSPADMDIKLMNKVYWDGRDEDGDEIANGVYLYKVIAKYPDKNITEIKKLAKVK